MRSIFTLAALMLSTQLVAQQATQTDPNRGTEPSIRLRTPDENSPGRTIENANARDASAGAQQKVVRASEIIGTNVKNKANEDLGSINDLVIDPMDGRIAYAAVSMGGFLGVGDKLFAVPWEAIECREVEGDHVAYLDVNKQTLENAQGFNQENWPDMANERWQMDNDRPYTSLRPRRHEVARPIQQPGARQPGLRQPGSQRLDSQQPDTVEESETQPEQPRQQ